MGTESTPDPADVTIRTAASPRSFGGGRYTARRPLGEGGQHVVHLVYDEALDRECALALIRAEMLQPDDIDRFRREARAMARLPAHANLVTVFDIGDDGGRPYIVCEYVPGGDLRVALRDAAGALPIERAIGIARDVASGLATAHARGIVHRDIKPANIWLTEDGSAKVGDFGLAFAIDATRLTADGTLQGTAAYMAPEQALGGAAEARSDLYSLGCTLYELVTGRPPFLGDDPIAVISQHIETPPVAPSWHNAAVPAALEALVLRLLAKSPAERPPTAAAVVEALDAIASTPTIAATDVPRVQNPLDRLAAGIFVGRAPELAQLRSGLDGALSGRGQLLLLVGEPGIGKTRTANELCTYARLRGALVLAGRCYESEGAPSYWPWVQVVRSYVADADAPELDVDMGPGAADIAQMVSEVHAKLPGLTAPPAIEPDQARFRLFDSITTFLKNASRRQPLVLFLDDLHWADKASLLMLQYLARELGGTRLLVLGTYRDVELGRQHPLAQTLAELAREQIGARVLLRGIDEADTARYIAMSAGIEPPAALVAAVFRETEGNPFFLSEVVRLLASEGRLQKTDDAAWTVTIPQSVREVVGRRLDQLSADCNGVLTVAAVVGREFGLDALERLTAHDGDRLLALLEEAEAARVIHEVGVQGQRNAIGRYSFSHALIRETLYDELSTTRRVRLHKQIGETLEALYAADIDAHLSELAYHFGEAAAAGEVEKAIDYARRAGEYASALFAHEEGAAQFARALQSLELERDSDELARCSVLRRLGECQIMMGEPKRAVETLSAAGDIALRLGVPHELALTALSYGTAAFRVAGNFDERSETLVEAALTHLPEDDAGLRLHFLAGIANNFRIDGDRRMSLAREAYELAEEIGDPIMRARAADGLSAALWSPEHMAERLRMADHLIELGDETNDPGVLQAGHEQRLQTLMQLGDMEESDREIEICRRLGQQVRFAQAACYDSLYLAMRALMRGEFAASEQLTQLAIRNGRATGADWAIRHATEQIFLLRREQGRLAEIEQVVRSYGIAGRREASLLTLCIDLGYIDEARLHYQSICSSGLSGIPKGAGWVMLMCLLAEACDAIRHEQYADELYGLLLPFAGQNAILTFPVYCFGAVCRFLGLLAATMGRHGDAARHFDDAIEMNRRMGAPPFVAHTQHDYASMLLRRDDVGDRERALGRLDEAIATAEALGMKALLDKATARRASVPDADGSNSGG